MAFMINPPTNITIDTTQPNRAIGEALWQSLGLEADVLKLTKDVLDIIIESDNPQTLQLPWELLEMMDILRVLKSSLKKRSPIWSF